MSLKEGPRPFSFVAIATVICGSILLAGAVWFSAMGFRPSLAEALVQPIVLAKTALPLLISAAAVRLAMSSARPATRLNFWWLSLVLLTSALLFLGAWAATPSSLIGTTVLGQTAVKCLSTVVGLSMLPLLVGLIFLKSGASTTPTPTGALIGLAAGAGAAAGYSLGCTEDSPLFHVAWYGLAIGISSMIGAGIGNRLLRW